MTDLLAVKEYYFERVGSFDMDYHFDLEATRNSGKGARRAAEGWAIKAVQIVPEGYNSTYGQPNYGMLILWERDKV